MMIAMIWSTLSIVGNMKGREIASPYTFPLTASITIPQQMFLEQALDTNYKKFLG